MRRVVVTGLGMVSPLGCGVEPTWKHILDSRSGARKIDTFDVSDLPSRAAGTFARMVSRCLSLSASVIGVAIKPGAMQLAVTLRLAYSAPSVLIMPIMPALAAV